MSIEQAKKELIAYSRIKNYYDLCYLFQFSHMEYFNAEILVMTDNNIEKKTKKRIRKIMNQYRECIIYVRMD